MHWILRNWTDLSTLQYGSNHFQISLVVFAKFNIILQFHFIWKEKLAHPPGSHVNILKTLKECQQMVIPIRRKCYLMQVLLDVHTMDD